MHLRAKVSKVSGLTEHFRVESGANDIGVSPAPEAVTVEIVEQDGGIYLLRYDGDGQFVADTWHTDASAAKSQASFEFGITDGDWEDVTVKH